MSVLVTGAGGAIGGAIVARLLAQGRAVVAHDMRAPATPVDGVRQIVGDIGDQAALTDELTQLGVELEAVIAAHGVDGSAALIDLEDAFVRRVMTVNAASLPRLLRAVRPHLGAGAPFVVVGSQAGLVGESDNAAYCASKFAVHAWALAERDDGVVIRVLAPGCTETPLLYAAQERFANAQGVPTQQFVDARRARIPLQRFARVEETAAATVYLAGTDGPRPRLLTASGGEVLW
ncbi:MAG TPA: SDR family NAD(P)-dependent oxidoreductase [Conexibacter sp.]